MADEGLDLKVRLMRLQKTQRWLMDKLQSQGFKGLNDSLMSHILNGRYPYKKGREVIQASKIILDEVEQDTQKGIA